MPDGRDGPDSMSYRPTSLDFINLPNPIEPHAGQQKHPLNGAPRLETSRLGAPSNQDLFKLILESGHASQDSLFSASRSPKRRKAIDSVLLDLPKLPVRTSTKRLRIPPTLSGLHQPPPNAGLLPSINVEQPQVPPPRSNEPSLSFDGGSSQSIVAAVDGPVPSSGELQRPQPSQSRRRTQRNKWDEDETDCLLKGVARFGIGNWTRILNCSDYRFNNRTALDLKDRFRVCCPDDYKSNEPIKSSLDLPESSADLPERHKKAPHSRKPKGPAPERISSHKLKNLGIDKPFLKTPRRQRHIYSSAEDEALLKGFQKHGNAWAAIRQDKSLGLLHRKPTDLRDRFRTRYPQAYSQAGLSLRTEKTSKVDTFDAETTQRTVYSQNKVANVEAVDSTHHSSGLVSVGTSSTDDGGVLKSSSSGKPNPRSTFSTLDDVFLGMAFDTDAATENHEPIVLDRGILDWATNDIARSSAPDAAKISGIDPLMTLNPSRPISKPTASVTSITTSSAFSNAPPALPSFAALVSSGIPNTEPTEQMELPSVMQWYGGPEIDYRPGAGGNTFPTLDELLG